MDLSAYLGADVGRSDLTTELTVPDTEGSAYITVEEDCVVAGMEEAETIFRLVGAKAKCLVRDGDRVKAGTRVMDISGPLRGLITAERTALNFLMHMSGVATVTSEAVEAVDGKVIIAATRKTTPGFGDFQKKAVALGGGDPHRYALDSMIMVKDNHIAAAGGMDAIAAKIKDVPEGVPVEIEVLDHDEGIKAAKCGADIVMGDHFSPEEVKRLREDLRKINPDILVEASGNITPETAIEYAGCADIVSLGALTHSVKSTHFSMDVE